MNYDDPDYQTFNSNLKIKEENDVSHSMQNIKRRFDDSFQSELKMRQTQLETIENRLVKARKTLHLLRYALVTSYYKNQEFEVSKAQEDIVADKQNRIHPAVKRLLGNNLDSLQNFNNRRKRIKVEGGDAKNKVIQESAELSMKVEAVQETVVKQERVVKQETIVKPETVVKQDALQSRIETTADKNNDYVDGIRNRKQVKRRIIVGNISKWMPAECKSDNTTHKWMVYVRTPKDCEDISTFVEKVLFYLHPSYKPNDIIELKSSPFHLSRRGWGEFPLRVRIFFKCELNKPVDVIHNLKLDKTYTGRQTLGNETIVDLSLFENESETVFCEIKQEIVIEPTTTNESISNIEQESEDAAKNQDVDNDPEVNGFIFLEHSYTLSPGQKAAPSKLQEALEMNICINVTESDSSPEKNINKEDRSNVPECSYQYQLLDTDEIIKKEDILSDIFETNTEFFQ